MIKISFYKKPIFWEKASEKTGKIITYCKLEGVTQVLGYHFNVESTSTAICSDDDNYNQEIGRKVALAKAENAIYNSLAKNLAEISKDFVDSFTREVSLFISKSAKFQESNNNYIDRLINEVQNNSEKA